MKKKALLLLSLLLVFSFTGCSTKQKKDAIGEDPYKDYKQITTSYGLSYKVPKKWKVADSNTETSSYYYKNEVGSGDGMLYVTYSDFEGDITNSKIFEEFSSGIKKSGNYKNGFRSEYTKINNIPLERFYYNMEVSGETYKTQSIIFNCGNGYAMISMSSFPKSNYDSFFDKITHSVESDSSVTTEAVAENTEATESTTETTAKTTTEATTEATTETHTPTTGEENALSKAFDYLEYTAFSKSGLIEQLEYEGFSKKEAKYAANNCGANWKQQAVKKAKEYLANQSFSKSGLIEQLEYEGFTKSQATYGVNKAYK